jgi:cytochrome c oxidase assembly factor CtaG
MVQHEMLMAAAAPLLVLGRPIVAWLWAVPISVRRGLGAISTTGWVHELWERITRPWAAWTIHAAAIWLWHAPRLYQSTLDSELMHTAQHSSFLVSALLFWWALLRGRDGRLGRPTAVVYLFTTAVHTSLLGALLTFSDRVWYPIYETRTAAWGMTPLEDQQLAGLIMWVPAGLAYLVAALAVAASWLKDPRHEVILNRVERTAATVLVAMLGIAGCRRGSAMTAEAAAQITGGNPERGALAIRQYGCAACHSIPGIPGARGTVGPALGGIGGRPYIAGVLTNTPGNLTRWIQDPQKIDSLTAMPDVGVTEPVARDIASYLYTTE